MQFLKGYRTYLLGAAGLVVIGLYLTGVIDDQIANVLLTVFGFGGLITLRAALPK